MKANVRIDVAKAASCTSTSGKDERTFRLSNMVGVLIRLSKGGGRPHISSMKRIGHADLAGKLCCEYSMC